MSEKMVESSPGLFTLSEQVCSIIFSYSGGYNYTHRWVCKSFREVLPEVSPLLYLDHLIRDKRKPKEIQPSEKLMQQAVDMHLFHLLEFGKDYIPKDIFYKSAEKADLEMLQWCKERLSKDYFACCEYELYEAAIKSREVKVFQWIKDNLFAPETNFTEYIAEVGFLDGLKWYVAQNKYPDLTCFHLSVYNKHIEVVRYLLSLDVETDDQLCTTATTVGDLDMLKLLIEKGCLCNEETFSQAAFSGNLEMCKWLKERGFVWNEQVCAQAALAGHLELLQWLRDNGCPWNENTPAFAARGGHLELLQWVMSNGCLWNAQVYYEAVSKNHLHIIKFAHSRGCPWNEYVCYIATYHERLDLLKWLISHGCPWDRGVYDTALERGYTEIVDCVLRNLGKRVWE
ncbi:ankyrin repeat-containing protein [Cedratvirus kamchatka]|uniref:Ankyrin repeat-containing protein n=1 Tax=Cedratvirus kamchatka TaxID=2716914 RepID=A0A6G8MZ06_9VIRU|nr:ankyrin repeat-containing protein [Cedratvirus kamchatka]